MIWNYRNQNFFSSEAFFPSAVLWRPEALELQSSQALELQRPEALKLFGGQGRALKP